jgi:hypothetical protein
MKKNEDLENFSFGDKNKSLEDLNQEEEVPKEN